MLDMGWSAVQWEEINSLLLRSHRIFVKVEILDMSMKVLRDVSNRLVGGNVDMDATSEITRSAQVTLFNGDNGLGLDVQDPTETRGGLIASRMIRVTYGIGEIEDQLSKYNFPIFTGPITKAPKSKGMIEIEAQGKDFLSAMPLWDLYSFGFGKHDDAIRGALSTATGERDFKTMGVWPRINKKIPWVVIAGENLMVRCRELAAASNNQIYYNGYGVCVLRPRSSTSVYTFTKKNVTSLPESEFDITRLFNCVRVTGAEVQGMNGSFVYEAYPSPTHPLSPQSLAVNGKPRRFPLIVENNDVDSSFEVSGVARQMLSDALETVYDSEFTCPVLPFLEEGDYFRLNVPGVYALRKLTKWSIPLAGDAEMSIGFLSSSIVSKVAFTKKTGSPTAGGGGGLPGLDGGGGAGPGGKGKGKGKKKGKKGRKGRKKGADKKKNKQRKNRPRERAQLWRR